MQMRRQKNSSGPTVLGTALIVSAILLILPTFALAYILGAWLAGYNGPPPKYEPVRYIGRGS